MSLLAYAYLIKVALCVAFYLFIQLGRLIVKRSRTIIWMVRYIRNKLLLLLLLCPYLLCRLSTSWCYRLNNTDRSLALEAADNRTEASGKQKGGGLCFFINERWRNNHTVKRIICAPDIELLSITFYPPFLPAT